MIKLVIFDLDGTLIDTLADLAQATNYALRTMQYPEHELYEYKMMVGNGIDMLLRRALPEDLQTDEKVAQLRQIFVPYYDLHNTDESRPYDGICQLLQALHNNGILLAVASNKYHSATKKIVRHFFPTIPFVAVFGHRQGKPRKPNPTIVEDILAGANVNNDEVLYLGDTTIDILTAQNASVASVAVTWGFRTAEELASAHPNHLITTPTDLIPLVKRL